MDNFFSVSYIIGQQKPDNTCILKWQISSEEAEKVPVSTLSIATTSVYLPESFSTDVTIQFQFQPA